MVFGDPDVELVFGQIGDVAGQRRGVVMHGLAHQNPSHVGPPFAVAGRMRIAVLIRKLMMNAMGSYPEDWAAFEGRRGAHGKEILDPFGSSVASVREQPVIAHADAQTAGDPPHDGGHEKSLPGEKEQGGYRANMKSDHERGGDPVNVVVAGLAFPQVLKVHGGWFFPCPDL